MTTRASRESREQEVRDTETRARTWRPADQLPMPEEIPGYKLRWLRISTLGELDSQNVSKARREGWEMIKPEEMPDLARDCDNRQTDIIEFGGLALAKMPIEMWKEMRDYYQEKSDSQNDSIDGALRSMEDKRMPLHREYSSKTSGRLRD